MTIPIDPSLDILASWADANRPEHPVLAQCRLETTNRHGLAEPFDRELARFMTFLIEVIDARLAVQIGVSGSYNALLIGLALRAAAGPGARLLTFGTTEDEAKRAQAYWDGANLQDVIEPRGGRISDGLDGLAEEGYQGHIDFISIDASGIDYPALHERGLSLLRSGGLMVVNNGLAVRHFAEALIADQSIHKHFLVMGGGLLLLRKL